MRDAGQDVRPFDGFVEAEAVRVREEATFPAAFLRAATAASPNSAGPPQALGVRREEDGLSDRTVRAQVRVRSRSPSARFPDSNRATIPSAKALTRALDARLREYRRGAPPSAQKASGLMVDERPDPQREAADRERASRKPSGRPGGGGAEFEAGERVLLHLPDGGEMAPFQAAWPASAEAARADREAAASPAQEQGGPRSATRPGDIVAEIIIMWIIYSSFRMRLGPLNKSGQSAQ